MLDDERTTLGIRANDGLGVPIPGSITRNVTVAPPRESKATQWWKGTLAVLGLVGMGVIAFGIVFCLALLA